MNKKQGATTRNEPLSFPITVKIAKADYEALRHIAQKHGVTISSAVRFAASLGLPKVRDVFSQLEGRAS